MVKGIEETMNIFLYNTMKRGLEEFIPIEDRSAGMYACGPTVYNYAHVGNLRTYVFEDVLRRVLEYAGYQVNHVMNVTDVGHLTDDEDDGEDKMLKASRETGRSVWDIAQHYTDVFFADIEKLNIRKPHVICRATEHIQDMIALVERLEDSGYTYSAGGNIYFSIDAFPEYGRLAKLNLEELQEGARIEVDENKRNPKDFVLWFTKSKFENQVMIWDSPWGKGYPGWHLECSAMSMKYLGEQFDIHCGGTDHINVHHTNEIAQSEAATGKQWVKYWCHGEFLLDDTGKMSKSRGEFLTLELLMNQGYDPLDYRYFCLNGHYRSQLRFSFEALDQARKSREKLGGFIRELLKQSAQSPETAELGEEALGYQERFESHAGNDLNMPRCLAEAWKLVKNQQVSPEEKLMVLYRMDRILGLKLQEISGEEENDLDEDSARLIKEREAARSAKQFSRADEIRDILESRGIEIKDTPSGTVWRKRV